jgi:glycosyltransferase involved in cell wall biosynthesis
MKISVVILSYNIEDYIEDAINSVLSQTLPAFEIILADDGSTDNTVAKAQGLYSPLITLAKRTNQGALLNGLDGLIAASGDVVCFLDGDDVWEHNKLEVVGNEFSNRLDLVILSHKHVRVDIKLEPLNIRDDTHANIERIEQLCEEKICEELRKSLIERRGYWLGSAYSIRRSKLDLDRFANLVRSHPDVSYGYLDLVLGPFMAITNKQGLVGYTPMTTLYYRIHGGASASQLSERGALMGLRRVIAINRLTRHCLERSGAKRETLIRYDLLIQRARYLKELYFGNKLNSLLMFLRLVKELLNEGGYDFGKEFLRLIVCMLFGLKGIIWLKRFRSRI